MNILEHLWHDTISRIDLTNSRSTMPMTRTVPPDPGLAPELQDRYVRVMWAAEALGIHFTTLYKQIEKGQLEAVQISPSLSVLRIEDVANWEPRKPGPQPKE